MNQSIPILLGSIASLILLSPAAGLAQEMPSQLQEGMPYGEARQLILNAGWQALSLPVDRAQTAPLDYIIGDLGYDEVVDCSGTGMGLCRFEFSDAYGRLLVVITANNQSDLGGPTLYRWFIEE